MDPARRQSLGLLLLAVLLGLGSASGGRPSEAQPPAPRAATPAEGATPRLIGVVIAPDGRGRAYLQDTRTGGVRAYEVGEAVGDARVVAIEPDRVVLDRSGSRIDIRFSRVSGGEGAPAPTGPAVAPQPEPAVPPAAETGPSPDPAAGSQPPVPAPGQPAPPAADPQPCPPSCPAPAAPVGPGPRPSP